MTASAILALGTTTATSAVVSLAAGASANLVVFTAAGPIPTDAIVDIVIAASNGAMTLVKRMTGGDFTCTVTGPGDYYAIRETAGRAGTPVGIDKNI